MHSTTLIKVALTTSLIGIIGLFIGAIILALGYEILQSWMGTDELNNPKQPVAEPAEEAG